MEQEENKYLKQAEEEGLIEIKRLYDNILELYESGIRQYKEIAEILEIDKVTVKRYLKKAEGLGQIKTISREEEIRQKRKKSTKKCKKIRIWFRINC